MIDKRIEQLAVLLDGKKAYLGASGKIAVGLFILVIGGLIILNDGDTEIASSLIVGGIYAISDGVQGIGQRAATAKVEDKVDEAAK